MSAVAEPKPEFQCLSEDAILAALEDSDPANAVAVEVARLITAYTENFQDHVARLGHIPQDILRIKARWPIEAVAMRLVTQAISETVAKSKA